MYSIWMTGVIVTYYTTTKSKDKIVVAGALFISSGVNLFQKNACEQSSLHNIPLRTV